MPSPSATPTSPGLGVKPYAHSLEQKVVPSRRAAGAVNSEVKATTD